MTEVSTIQLTENALAAAVDLARQPDHVDKSLRLYIDGKGCDGFYYGVCFDDAAADDKKFLHGSIELIVDQETLIYVEGSTIDWVDDERGKGFLVNNPNHRKFRGKFFRRKQNKAWIEERRAELNPS